MSRKETIPVLLFSLLILQDGASSQEVLPLSTAQKEDETNRVIAEIRDLVKSDSWEEAYWLVSNFLKTVRNRRDPLPSLRLHESVREQLSGVVYQHSGPGQALQTLGLYDEALAYYASQLKQVDDREKTGVAQDAALAAARKEDWRQAAQHYRFVETNGQGWAKDPAKRRADLAEKFLQSPQTVESRITFTGEFWIGKTPGEGQFWQDAARMLEQTLSLAPSPAEKKRILRFLVDYYRKLGEEEAVERRSAEIAREFPDDGGLLAEIILARGCDAYERKDYDTAVRFFRQITAGRRKTPSWADAQYNIGVTLAERRQYAEAVKEFEAILRENVDNRADTGDLMAPFKNYQHNACHQISRCHEAMLNFRAALEYEKKSHEEFRLHTFCGTCGEAERNRHQQRMTLLQGLIAAEKDGPKAIFDAALRLHRESNLLSLPVLKTQPQAAADYFLPLIVSRDKKAQPALYETLKEIGIPRDRMSNFRDAFDKVDRNTKILLLIVLENSRHETEDLRFSFLSNLLERELAAPGGDNMMEFITGALAHTAENDSRYLVSLLSHSSPKIRELIRDLFRDNKRISHEAVQPVLRFLPQSAEQEQHRIMNLLAHIPPAGRDAPVVADILQKFGDRLVVRMELGRRLEDLCAQTEPGMIDWNKVLEMTSLMVAVERNDLPEVRRQVKSGADLNATDYRKNTALIRAIRRAGWHEREIVELLTNGGADLDKQGENDTTALMEAVALYKPEIAKLLVERGAKLNLRGVGDASALSIAAEKRFYRILDILIRRGIDLNTNLGNNRNILMWLCGRNRADLAKRVMDLGIDIDATDGEGKTALIWAVVENPLSMEIPALLLNRGADMRIKDLSGKTACDYAESDAMRKLLSIR